MTPAAPPPTPAVLTPAGYEERLRACGATREHPIYPVPTFEHFQRLAANPQWLAQFPAMLQQREETLRLMAADPLHYGHEPQCWKDADVALAGHGIVSQCNFGANRSGKSWRAAKRLCEAALAYHKGVLIIVGETEKSSIETQQTAVWHYLKPLIGKYNDGKRSSTSKVAWTDANGFADGKVVLPGTGTKLFFCTYKMPAGDYEGWEFGAETDLRGEPLGGWKFRADGTRIENIGYWLDESATLPWFETLHRRVRFRHAKGIWTFTPILGITPPIREVLGTPRPLVTRPAELLPQAKVPGCPPGHMPYIVQPGMKETTVIYFHLTDNPFHDYYNKVKQLCAGRTTEEIERLAYGYARNTISRAFPMFGPANIVTAAQVPDAGSVYHYVDPHGTRNYFCLWVLVTPGADPAYYIIRDWPDRPTYGDWAVVSRHEVNERTRKGWDGDRGPAQPGQGWGPDHYAQCWREQETILSRANQRPGDGQLSDAELAAGLARLKALPVDAPLAELDAALAFVRLPFHRQLLKAAHRRGEDVSTAREPVEGRYMDGRFGPTPQSAAEGVTSLFEQFAEMDLHFEAASGRQIKEGVAVVHGLLEWNPTEPRVPHINAPRLYVLETCEQVLWAMSNYTGWGSEEDGGKDPVDLVRHLAESAPTYVPPGALQGTGGGSY